MNLRQYAAQAAQQPQKPQKTEKTYTPLHREQEAQRAENARSLAICQEYNAIRAKSGQLAAEILKGLNAGESPYILLMKAAECIGLLTGENHVFFRNVKDKITEIYGQGLTDSRALEIELADVRQRLEMLTRPELEKTANIENAVRAHKEREQEILSLQEKGLKKAEDDQRDE